MKNMLLSLAIVAATGSSAVGAVSLTVSGNCPGTVTVSWNGATPKSTMGIVFSQNDGLFTIGGGPCSGTELGLSRSGLRLVRTVNTGSGAGQVNGNAGAGACGGKLQLVIMDGSPCTTSNVAELP